MDFVITQGQDIKAIEVKSGRVKALRGVNAFLQVEPRAKVLVIGSAECPLEDFLLGKVPLF